MTALRLAFLTLWRKRFSSLVAVLSIALAVGMSGLLLRLYLLSESRFQTLARGSDVVVGAKSGGIEMILSALNGEGPYPGFLPMKLFETLRAQQGVKFEDGTASTPKYLKAVIPFIYFGKYDDFRGVGTDESFFERDGGDALSFSEGKWEPAGTTAVLGALVARRTHLKVGDHIGVPAWVGDDVAPGPKIDLQITGILRPTRTAWDKNIYTNVAAAQIAISGMPLQAKSIWGHDVLNFFLIDLEPGGGAPLESLINRRTVGQAVFVDREKARLHELAGAGENVGLSLTVLILILGGLAVASMLISRFDGMSGQVAVLRALGYPKSFLLKWLVWEGLLLGVSACLLGALVDAALFSWLRDLFGAALPSADLMPSSILQSYPVWAAALFTTTAAVFFPMWRLSRQSVHESLRS